MARTQETRNSAAPSGEGRPAWLHSLAISTAAAGPLFFLGMCALVWLALSQSRAGTDANATLVIALGCFLAGAVSATTGALLFARFQERGAAKAWTVNAAIASACLYWVLGAIATLLWATGELG